MVVVNPQPPRANPENLLTIIKEASQGKVVLPEFQRSFVWTRENIEELLVSILQGYFIGTFLILDTPPEQAIFPFRPVEGSDTRFVDRGTPHHPTVRLVLDGQQRITSLFYVLYEPDIPLSGSRNSYHFFLRLDALVKNEPEDAVVGVSLADRSRYSKMLSLLNEGYALRFSSLLNPNSFYQWLYEQQTAFRTQEERQAISEFFNRFSQFMVPVVSVSPETGRENIINIFERINRTGVSLSLFDLTAARLYRKGINLRGLWKEFTGQNKELSKQIKPEFVLKTIALLAGREVRKSVLLDVIDELDVAHFETQWRTACTFLAAAYRRLISPQGYGVIAPRWIHYTTLLVPLAVLLHYVEERHGGEVMYRKIDRWYWASVFGQRYDQAVDTSSYRDVREVKEWLDGGTCPNWLQNWRTDQLDLETISDQRSVIYRGLMCLIVKTGAKDFINGQAAVLAECQDDHIFPRARYRHEPLVNSILNRTLISSTSNQIKSDRRPSEYLPMFLEQHGGNTDRLRDTLNSHLISEEAQQAMERDNFSAFLQARKQTFQQEIARRVRGDP